MVEPGKDLSQYRILRRIGAGGMAEVFLAKKLGAAGFSRTVAIKTILAHGAQKDAISLFLDEARVASALQHAAIVQTLDLGFEDETLFIVMEYVPGPALSRMIYEMKQRQRFLSPQVVAFIGARIANALDFAHRRVTTGNGQPLALVHRDVSPQNILVTRTGIVKLTDFGVARASIQTHKTKTGQVRGKAAYMAPEQVRAQALDGRTDMFALGLVLYEALTGVRPYQRKSEIMSMRAILNEEVGPIHETNPNVPHDLVKVIQRTLMKKPADRYADCGELESELQKTYRSKHRDSSIEEEIKALMLECFGDEDGNVEDGQAVEAWQPTISIGKDGVAAMASPQRLPGRSLSPEIAALLGQAGSETPGTPVSGEGLAPDGGFGTGSGGVGRGMGSGGMPAPGTRGETMPPVGRGLRPGMPPPNGTNPYGGAMPMKPGPNGSTSGIDPASLMAYAGTAGYSGVQYPPGMTPNPATMAPMGLPLTQGGFATPASGTYPTGVQGQRERIFTPSLLIIVLASLMFGGLIAYLVLRPSSDPPATQIVGLDPNGKPAVPPPPVAPIPPAPANVGAHSTGNEPEPATKGVPTKEVPTKVVPAHVAKAPPKRVKVEEPAVAKLEAPPETKPPQDDRTLLPRVMALKKKAGAGSELSEKLGKLAMDLMQGHQASKADQELVDDAERKLR